MEEDVLNESELLERLNNLPQLGELQQQLRETRQRLRAARAMNNITVVQEEELRESELLKRMESLPQEREELQQQLRETRQRLRVERTRENIPTEQREELSESELLEKLNNLPQLEELQQQLRETRQKLRAARAMGNTSAIQEEELRESELLKRMESLPQEREELQHQLKETRQKLRATGAMSFIPVPENAIKSQTIQDKSKPTPVILTKNGEPKDFCDIIFDSKTSTYSVTYRIDGKDGYIDTKTNKRLSSSNRKTKDTEVAKYLNGSYVDIFDGFDRQKIKHYDAKLIAILFSRFGKEDSAKGVQACRQYLEQLELGDKADKSKLPYTMKYDLRNVKESTFADGTKMSLLDRIRYIRMARKNQYVARVEPERNKFGWKGLAAIGAGVLIALGIGTHQKNEKYFPGPDRNISDSDRGIKQDKKLDLNSDEKNADKGEKDPFADIKIQGHNLVFGDIVRGTEGERLAETASRESVDNYGNVVSIGEDETLNPVNGYYVVDRAASRDENGNISAYQYGLEGEIPEDMTYVHLSLVKGADTYEEAKKIVESQVETAKTTTVDQDIIAQRGWTSKDEVKVIFEKQQEERDKANNPVILKPVDKHHQGLEER